MAASDSVTEAIGGSTWELPLNLSLLPTQTAFLSDWQYKFRAYGGGFANGKSAALVAAVSILLMHFPRNRGFLGQLDGKKLKQTTMQTFYELIPPAFYHKNDQAGRLTFKDAFGGSTLFYGDMKDARMVNMQLNFVAVDQAEEISEEHFNYMAGRLRWHTPLYDDHGHVKATLNPYGFFTFNPEGRNWIWKLFHPDSPDHQPLKDEFKLYEASTYESLAAGIAPADYVETLKKIYPPAMLARYLEGSWDAYEGRVFPQFDPGIHVIDPMPLRPSWRLFESIDHGFQSPTACGWWAFDPDGNAFLVAEYYQAGLAVKENVQNILAIRKSLNYKGPLLTYLDSACWQRNQSDDVKIYAVADEYIRHGLTPIKAQKDWDSGYSRICEYLAPESLHRHPVTGQPGATKFYVFAPCQQFINEMIGYRWKKRGMSLKNAPDEPIDYNDHHMDAMSYLFAARPSHPTIQLVETVDLLLQWRRLRDGHNPLAEPVSNGNCWSI